MAGQARARPKRLKPRPSLAGAWGSLWHALALKEAPGEPAGRRLSQLGLDLGVRDFDHHCPFTRNCIGARNYSCFIAFLLSVSVSLAVLLIVPMLSGASPLPVEEEEPVTQPFSL